MVLAKCRVLDQYKWATRQSAFPSLTAKDYFKVFYNTKFGTTREALLFLHRVEEIRTALGSRDPGKAASGDDARAQGVLSEVKMRPLSGC